MASGVSSGNIGRLGNFLSKNEERITAFSNPKSAIQYLTKDRAHKLDMSKPLRANELISLEYLKGCKPTVEELTTAISELDLTDMQLGKLLHFSDKFRKGKNPLPSVRTSYARKIVNILQLDNRHAEIDPEELRDTIDSAKHNTTKKTKDLDGIAKLKMAIYNILDRRYIQTR